MGLWIGIEVTALGSAQIQVFVVIPQAEIALSCTALLWIWNSENSNYGSSYLLLELLEFCYQECLSLHGFLKCGPAH